MAPIRPSGVTRLGHAQPVRTRFRSCAAAFGFALVAACAPVAPPVPPGPSSPAPVEQGAPDPSFATLPTAEADTSARLAKAPRQSGEVQALPSVFAGKPSLGQPALTREGLYIPSNLPTDRPVPVVLALHGMGGSGDRMTQRLAEFADRNGWIVVAPSMVYRDYMDPEQVRLDDQDLLPRLRDMLDAVPLLVPANVRVADRAFIYGFSRGGQLAHRFALFYPERVAAVVALASGSYTMPTAVGTGAAGGAEASTRFPFGVADLTRYVGHPFDLAAIRKVPFYIGVGANDASPDGVPRPFDALEGTTRVERARAFAASLRTLGVSTTLDLIPGIAHEESSTMRANATDFLAAQSTAARP